VSLCNKPVNDEFAVVRAAVTHRAKPRRLLLVHTQVSDRVKALQMVARHRPTRNLHTNLTKLNTQTHNLLALRLGQCTSEPVPEDNFWTLWCKGRLTEADTPTIRLGATPTGLKSAHLHHLPPFFTGRMPFLPPNQQCQSTEGN